MKFKLEIGLDGAAFDCGEEDVASSMEVTRILHHIAEKIAAADLVVGKTSYIRECNGNRCGWWEVVAE